MSNASMRDGSPTARGKIYDMSRRLIRTQLVSLIIVFRLVYERDHPEHKDYTNADVAVYSMREEDGSDLLRTALAHYAFIDGPLHIMYAELAVRKDDFNLRLSVLKHFLLECISPAKSYGLNPDEEKQEKERLNKNLYALLLSRWLTDYYTASPAVQEETRLNLTLRTEVQGESQTADGRHEHQHAEISRNTASHGHSDKWFLTNVGPITDIKKATRQDLQLYTRPPPTLVPRVAPEKIRLPDIFRNVHDWLVIKIGDHVANRPVQTPWTIDKQTGLPHVINYTKSEFPVHAGRMALPAYLATRVTPGNASERPAFNLHIPEVAATEDTDPPPTVSEVPKEPSSQKARVELARTTCESKIRAYMQAQGEQFANPHLHPTPPASVLTPMHSDSLRERSSAELRRALAEAPGCPSSSVDAPCGALGTRRAQSTKQHLASAAAYREREHVNLKAEVTLLSQQRNKLNRTQDAKGRLT